MTRRGLLLTMTEPPPAMEEEFNAWYDDEHMAERLAIPGFLSARRWVAELPAGEGKYLATYELDSPAVLTSPEYLARFQNATPWTRRCLSKATVFRRWACAQVEPGTADSHAAAKSMLLVAADAPIEPLALPAALQMRRFTASSGTPGHLCLYEFAWDSVSNLPPAGAGRLMRLYRAYGS